MSAAGVPEADRREFLRCVRMLDLHDRLLSVEERLPDDAVADLHELIRLNLQGLSRVLGEDLEDVGSLAAVRLALGEAPPAAAA